MVKEAEYKAVKARLNAPENASFKSKLPLTPNGLDITWHLHRIEKYVAECETAEMPAKELMELDFGVSLREIVRLMDEQGWK